MITASVKKELNNNLYTQHEENLHDNSFFFYFSTMLGENNQIEIL